MNRLCVVCFFLISVTLTGNAVAAGADIAYLKWSIDHRNRIFKSEEEAERFLFTFNNYLDRLGKNSACDPRAYIETRPNGKDDLKGKCRRKTSTAAPSNRNFRTRWSPYRHAYDSEYVERDVSSANRTIQIGLFRTSKGGWTQSSGYSCDWYIDDKLVAEKQNCRLLKTELSLGDHTVAVDIFRHGDLDFHYPSEGTEKITLHDHVIAVLGDSFGSGEGNPHTYITTGLQNAYFPVPAPARWLEPRCHRSLFSSSGLLTALLADRFTHDTFTLAQFACSGAETDEGILEPYYGRETANQINCSWNAANSYPRRTEDFYDGYRTWNRVPSCETSSRAKPSPLDIPAQIEQLRDTLCDKDGKNCRRPSLLIIYIGVNDIEFSKIVLSLQLKCKPSACEKALGKFIDSGLLKTKNNLDKIARKLEELGISPENPQDVILMTYPNPLTFTDGKKLKLCSWKNARFGRTANLIGRAGSFFALGMREASIEWAEKRVLQPLNETLRTAAERNGWTSLDMEHIADGHGFCSKGNRWFQTWPDSEAKQGVMHFDVVPDNGKTPGVGVMPIPTGVMHPNLFGHYNVEAQLMKAVPGLLDLKR